MTPEGQRELRQLGAAIRQKREVMDVSQEDFAELAGVHRTYIGQLERGEKNVSFVSILRVAQSLKVKPSALFKDAGL